MHGRLTAWRHRVPGNGWMEHSSGTRICQGDQDNLGLSQSIIKPQHMSQARHVVVLHVPVFAPGSPSCSSSSPRSTREAKCPCDSRTWRCEKEVRSIVSCHLVVEHIACLLPGCQKVEPCRRVVHVQQRLLQVLNLQAVFRLVIPASQKESFCTVKNKLCAVPTTFNSC